VVESTPEIFDAIAQDESEDLGDWPDDAKVEIFARSIRVGPGIKHYGFGLDIGADFCLKDSEVFFCSLELCPCAREVNGARVHRGST
jgi:hypothetical protein